MSYILEALKKSEQERGHGDIPDVQTIHSSSLNYRNDKKSYWPYLLTAAVIINILLLVYFIFDKEEASQQQVKTQQNNVLPDTKSTSDSTPVFDTSSDIRPVFAVDNIQQPVIISPPSSNAANEPDKQATNTIKKPAVTTKAGKNRPKTKSKAATTENIIAVKSTADEKISDYSATVLDFHELPDSIKQQLPAITISVHIYSSEPSQRSIVINNKFMEEGDAVIDDLILLEITTDGAIFNKNGTLFHYGVVSTWQ